jgi:F-type H+-transporting ATPase subunit epsilon
MSDTKTFSIEIVTPEKKAYSGEATLAIFPGAGGDFGVMPNHAAILSALNPGEIKIVEDKKETYFATAGGFVEVSNNKVSVIIETAELPADIAVDVATKDKADATEELKSATVHADILRIQKKIKSAEARLKVAARAGKPDANKH